jgi:hypothetical protein
LTEDPVRSAVELNFYVYARNNPVRFNDPSGLIVGQLIVRAFTGLIGQLGTTTAQELAVQGLLLESLAGVVGLGLGSVLPGATQNQAVPGLGGTTVGEVINLVTFSGGLRTLFFAGHAMGVGTVGGVAAIVSGVGAFSIGLTVLGSVEVGFAIDNLILDDRSLFPCGNPVLRVFTAARSFHRGD